MSEPPVQRLMNVFQAIAIWCLCMGLVVGCTAWMVLR